jgi:predicted alpha/beta-hydrolase family hydrolase
MLILLAPGAGAPSSSDWMQAWTRRLLSLARVEPFDYPYQREGRRVPDPLPVLVDAHREALARAREGHQGPVFLAGKSMGGRIACHLSLVERVDGLICFGYPLKAAGKSGALRDAVLRQLRTPVLFLQGTRDPLCPLELLAKVRPEMRAPHRLYVVEGGDHSLLVRKRDLAAQGRTQDDVDGGVRQAIASFVASPR